MVKLVKRKWSAWKAFEEGFNTKGTPVNKCKYCSLIITSHNNATKFRYHLLNGYKVKLNEIPSHLLTRLREEENA